MQLSNRFFLRSMLGVLFFVPLSLFAQMSRNDDDVRARRIMWQEMQRLCDQDDQCQELMRQNQERNAARRNENRRQRPHQNSQAQDGSNGPLPCQTPWENQESLPQRPAPQSQSSSRQDSTPGRRSFVVELYQSPLVDEENQVSNRQNSKAPRSVNLGQNSRQEPRSAEPQAREYQRRSSNQESLPQRPAPQSQSSSRQDSTPGRRSFVVELYQSPLVDEENQVSNRQNSKAPRSVNLGQNSRQEPRSAEPQARESRLQERQESRRASSITQREERVGRILRRPQRPLEPPKINVPAGAYLEEFDREDEENF